MEEITYDNIPSETKEMIDIYLSTELDNKLFFELLAMVYHHGLMNGKGETK